MQENQEMQKNQTSVSIPKNSIIFTNYCKGISLNNENSLFLLDSLFVIAVYAFLNGSLTQFQLLPYHSLPSAASMFLNKKSYFISSSQYSLILWSTTLLGSYKHIKKIGEHQAQIDCLALHPIDENLIFSSHLDNTIQIWSISIKKKPCQQTISVPIGRITQLIINQEGNKLIALGENKKILILKQNGRFFDKQHQVQAEQEIHKICFINNIIFVSSSIQMVLFSHVAENLQAYYLKEEAIDSLSSESLYINECIPFFKPDQFPFFYDQNKQVLLLVSNLDSGKLIIDQVIKYRSHQQFLSLIFASMSKDKKYLMISDLKSFKIDILELKDLY